MSRIGGGIGEFFSGIGRGIVSSFKSIGKFFTRGKRKRAEAADQEKAAPTLEPGVNEQTLGGHFYGQPVGGSNGDGAAPPRAEAVDPTLETSTTQTPPKPDLQQDEAEVEEAPSSNQHFISEEKPSDNEAAEPLQRNQQESDDNIKAEEEIKVNNSQPQGGSQPSLGNGGKGIFGGHRTGKLFQSRFARLGETAAESRAWNENYKASDEYKNQLKDPRTWREIAAKEKKEIEDRQNSARARIKKD